MSAYFRKSIKIAPGVHINLSKRGTGISFGARGAHVSFSPTGRVTKTVSIPGTGIYYRDVSTSRSRSKKSSSVEESATIQGAVEDLRKNTSIYQTETSPQPAAQQVVAVEHHGFYISHGFAAFTLFLAGVLLEEARKSQPRSVWEPVLIIAGGIALVLWVRDLLHSKREKRESPLDQS